MQGLAAFEKPAIAAVQGLAVGIGVTMLLHCDLVYVADDATFSMPFTSLGLVPEFASTLLLPQIAGRVRAAEKLLLGKPFPAPRRSSWASRTPSCRAAEVLPHAQKVARAFTHCRPGPCATPRSCCATAAAAAVKDAIFREASYFGPRLAGAEAREAISAILEKRPPDFSKFQ